MTEAFNEYIAKISDSLPERPLEPLDLIKAGLAGSPATLLKWRLNGYGPPFFKLGGRYFYLKEDVIEWLSSSYRRDTACVTK